MLEPVPTETERSLGAEPAAPVPAEDLLLSVARGDQMAFSELYDRLAPRVLGLVRRLVRDHAQSEEVTQEVFLEIWQSASRFEPNKGSIHLDLDDGAPSGNRSDSIGAGWPRP